MISRNTIGGGAMLALGIVALWQSGRLPSGSVHNPGPGFFPWWTSAVLVVLALVLLGQTCLRRTRGAAAEGTTAARRLDRVLTLAAVLVAYVAGLDPLGYPLCTFGLVVFMLRVTERYRWPVALAMAVVTAGASYVLFAVWLAVPLPAGPLAR